jgi:N-glycosylase/DNA lyase
LRQDPWECLASFLLSSTKQIPQIREGVRLLCERFGEAVEGPVDGGRVFAFPTAPALAGVSESLLRECRIGFRAKYLKGTAEVVAGGGLSLEDVGALPLEQARERLVALPGVGPKIADCVLLFAYGYPRAFPVDVWVMRALRELYFPGRRPPMARLKRFSETHFGPQAGYAQQYLFHHVRMLAGRVGKRRGTE